MKKLLYIFAIIFFIKIVSLYYIEMITKNYRLFVQTCLLHLNNIFICNNDTVKYIDMALIVYDPCLYFDTVDLPDVLYQCKRSMQVRIILHGFHIINFILFILLTNFNDLWDVELLYVR